MSGFVSRRKPPARPRRISEIKTGDEQIQVVGLVVDKGEAELFLDDGTGRLPVLFEDPGTVDDIDVGSKIRVFGTPLSVADSYELHAEIIQKLEGLDLNLYRKVKHEEKKFEKELDDYK
ncbi:hypothetical protein AKJ45_02295 [candidate division MSBL1 archaeon SCGC-AAA261F19]|uniref:OB domain-containing protein n=1 Tax=candidate division MSBL1 archaeon SCGC-AAA261F19 TaxID=1698275 RepID=A0A133V9R9_9EURY|nr:hypothetical protein AKJ45_02295 [candidate division MSBL1 archaeon SCGC-AAA261F19]